MSNIPKRSDEAAFPRPTQYREPNQDNVLLPAQWGLTKREFIATQIFAGMGDLGGSSENLAKHAVKRADLLLAELAKPI